jgi:uncharacterized protein
MMIRTFLLAIAFLFAVPAAAQTFPELTGRVVDQANLLDPGQEAALTARLEALERQSSRQLVVVTISSLEGYEISDYGYRLGRHWNIGQRTANNGVLLIIALSDRKMRIEVGYGLESILTDALSDQIIREQIRPRFRADDYPGGINAGVDAIIAQLQAPPEQAEARALAAAEAASEDGDLGSLIPIIFWVIVIGFMVVPFILSRAGGKKYRGRRGRRGPVIIWGPGLGSSGWGSGGGSSWGGGGSSWGGGGGGFSGGGGSFGGGGASGGW